MINLNTEYSLVEQIQDINTTELPYFSTYKPNISYINSEALKYRYFENIILIGNGGSNTSFRAAYHALPHDKNIIVLTTPDPNLLMSLSSKYNKQNTLVLAISKSGQTTTVLESLFYFLNLGYDAIAVTSENTALAKIISKKGLAVIPHPDIGGRFSANTASALFPLALSGINISKISSSILSQYELYNKNNTNSLKNNALLLAMTLFALEQKHYTEVFVPVYSYKLTGFLPLITQLMHETFCKQQKGLTFFGSPAPESQHHTNQRVFGGRKNIALLFLRHTPKDKNNNKHNNENNNAIPEIKVTIPDEISEISIKSSTLSVLNGLPYENALDFEFQGTLRHAIKQKIPSIVVTLGSIDETTIGSFIAFLQYTAVYSAWLRNLNPFDQPEVEYSKNISFELRKEYHNQEHK